MDAAAQPLAKRRKWTLAVALGAAGVATAIGGLWLFRFEIAKGFVESYLSQRGLEGGFTVERLDFTGARIVNVALGNASGPGVAISQADIEFGWGWRGPRLEGLTLSSPKMRARLDAEGLSLGGLERLAPQGGKSSAELPAIDITVINGALIVQTPFGDVAAKAETAGRLTEDFKGKVSLSGANPEAAGNRLDGISGQIDFTTEESGSTQLAGNIALSALRDSAQDSFALRNTRLQFDGSAPRNLEDAKLTLKLNSGPASAFGISSKSLEGNAHISLRGKSAPNENWNLISTIEAQEVSGSLGASALSADLRVFERNDKTLEGAWRISSPRTQIANLTREGRLDIAGSLKGKRTKEGLECSAAGAATLSNAALSANGLHLLDIAIPSGAGSPMATLLAGSRKSLIAAGADFSASTPFTFELGSEVSLAKLSETVSLESVSGARMRLTPKAPVTIDLRTMSLAGAGDMFIAGPGLPDANLTFVQVVLSKGVTRVEGNLSIADWQANDDRLSTTPIAFAVRRDGKAGQYSINGSARGDVSGGGVRITGLNLPISAAGAWGDGFTLGTQDRCTPFEFRSLAFAGILFNGQSLKLCGADDGTLLTSDAGGNWRGGASLGSLRWSGRLENGGQPILLNIANVRSAFGGAGGAPDFRFELAQPQLDVTFSPNRTIRTLVRRIDGATKQIDGQTRLEGRFEDAAFIDPALPARVTQIEGVWRAATENGRAVIRVDDARAFIEDISPPDPDGETRPRYNPLRLNDVDLALIDGQITGGGGISLADATGIALEEHKLATFTARHLISDGTGDAIVTARDLTFGPKLDLFDVSDLARGIVNDVTGPVNASLHARWRGDRLTTDGVVSFENLRLNAAAVGPVDGLSGALRFEDLLALRTAPDQKLTIKRLNPGVPVDNGEITLQVLNPQEVRISAARWPFAGGELSIAPQTVVIGEDTFRMQLQLSGVDMESLLKTLNFKDLTATGRVGGVFELRFDRNGGFVERSELRAEPGGGRISYIGAAGDGFTGFPKVAFDALRSFAYDNLVIEISGPLDGDIVSDIRFEGENVAPVSGVDIAGANLLPGIDRIKATGLPFRYKVSVRAPFRRLVENYQSTQDARPLVDEAIRREREPVDQTDKPPQ